MKIRRNYTLSPEADKKLRDIAKKTGLKMSTIIEKAIQQYDV